MAQQVKQQEQIQEQYLTFQSASTLYGITISNVLQVIEPQEITKVPEFPSYTKGVINLRGNIVSIIDMRLRLGKPEMQYDDRACIIVVYLNQTLIGLLVDAIDELVMLSEQEICDVGDDANQDIIDIKDFITSIAICKDKEFLVLDLARLISTT